MFEKISKKIQILKLLNSPKENDQRNKDRASGEKTLISKDIETNLKAIQQIFAGTSDLIVREFTIGSHPKCKAFIVMLSGLVDEKTLNENLIKPLLLNKDLDPANTFTMVKSTPISIANMKESQTLEQTVNSILSGHTALFIEGSETALLASLHGGETRSVEEPQTEAVVRGPREGFVESLGTNISLIRRKIRNSHLKFELMDIGTQTQTNVCMAYIEGIANPKIIEEVRTRLKKIEIDAVLESGYIEAFLEDAPLSIFPTVGNSEKPDIVSAKLLEGRVAILVNGTPFVLTVPYLFIEAFQNSEDYYTRPIFATFIRWLRWISFFFATFLPGLYVAITTFHQELLPPALLISIAAAQEGTPFPSFFEALLMQTIYEILREAGLRLPKPVGSAVSIVGALVIGDAAVSAGLVGAPMVVVIALTAISSFVVPSLSDVSTLSRFGLILLAGFAGLYGMMLGLVGFLAHQASLRSLGVPYMYPLAPSNSVDLKDVIIRVPLWAMVTRPRLLGGANPQRVNPASKPKPPQDNGGGS